MSAPRIPNSKEYWIKKGKKGKKVAIYFHDDLDGIYSAIAIKNYLINKNFEIVAYGVVNYNDGWKEITIKEDLINVAVDFAETNKLMDIYIDHHGEKFGNDNNDYAIKTQTSSAYEGILLQLGIAQDSIVLNAIDMVDSAKYEEYGLSFRDTLYYNIKHFKYTKTPKLYYAATMNQFIKRSSWKTLIKVVHNTKDISLYRIFSNFKKYYPANNKNKDFIEDGEIRISEVRHRTRGDIFKKKIVYKTQDSFIKNNLDKYKNSTKLNIKGYQIIGNLCYIPSGTWANAIRARAILEEDIEKGFIPKNQIMFILLQYGASLQIVCFNKINNIPDHKLPLLKNGDRVKNLGKYMSTLLENMKKYVGYTDISTFIGSDDDVTVAGGHGGIGTISNITGKVKDGAFKDVKYLDLIKNKIIQDISNTNWDNLKMCWSDNDIKNNSKHVNRFLLTKNIKK